MKTLNVVSYALGAMVLGAAAISAQAADIAAGKALVEKGGCVACHGKDLNAPISPIIPSWLASTRTTCITRCWRIRPAAIRSWAVPMRSWPARSTATRP